MLMLDPNRHGNLPNEPCSLKSVQCTPGLPARAADPQCAVAATFPYNNLNRIRCKFGFQPADRCRPATDASFRAALCLLTSQTNPRARRRQELAVQDNGRGGAEESRSEGDLRQWQLSAVDRPVGIVR